MSIVVFDHLIESDRLEVIDIYAGIQHQRVLLNQGPILGISIGVNVPMNHIAAHHVRPRHHWIMAERQLMLAVCGVEQIAGTFKPEREIAFLNPCPVMIADNKMLLPSELPQVFLRRFSISEHQITKDIDCVGIGDFFIPFFNKTLIHLINAGKRTIAKLDNIAMPQMEVACEEYHVSSPHFLFTEVQFGARAAKRSTEPSFLHPPVKGL